VPGAPDLQECGDNLTVQRFRYFPRRWEDLAHGAILENLRSRKSRWLQVLPFLVVGALLALGLARALNALALGEETARGLGVRVGTIRALTGVGIVLLCGGATAACGPIAFVGLAVPHLARVVTGPDQRWVVPWSMVLGGLLVVAADVIGRIVAIPAELEVGVVTAFVGAPVFLAIARRRRVVAL